MQSGKLRSKWQLRGGLKAGDEKSSGERNEKKCEEVESSDEESSSTGGEFHTDQRWKKRADAADKSVQFFSWLF